MTADKQTIISNFSKIIGQVLETYADLKPEAREDIAVFQSQSLAIFNRFNAEKKDGQNLKSYLEERGVMANLASTGNRDPLKNIVSKDEMTLAVTHVGIGEDEVKTARETVDTKKGLGFDVHGFAEIAENLGYISRDTKATFLAMQSHVRTIVNVESSEAVIASKPAQNAPNGEKFAFIDGLKKDPQSERSVTEVYQQGIHRFAGNEKDPAHVQKAQITQVISESVASHIKHSLKEGLSTDFKTGDKTFVPSESFLPAIKQVAVDGMKAVAEKLNPEVFGKAIADVKALTDAVSVKPSPTAEIEVYGTLLNTMRSHALQSSMDFAAKMDTFSNILKPKSGNAPSGLAPKP